MANMVIGTQNYLGIATITSGGAAPTAPASNLALPEPSDNLILTNASAAYVVIDLGSAQAVQLLAALYVGNPTPSTWRWRGAGTQAALTDGTASYDSGVVAFAPGNTGLAHRSGLLHDFLWLGAAQALEWWRLDFDVACSVGNLVIDQGWQPGTGLRLGLSPPKLVDGSLLRRAVGGRVGVTARAPYFQTAFTLEGLGQADALTSAGGLDQIVGAQLPCLCILDPAEMVYKQQGVVFGLLKAGDTLTNDYIQFYTRSFTISPELVP